jgi:hypothetical protein
VEKLKQVKILLFVQGDEWGGFWGAERRITSIDDLFQIRRWYFGGRYVEGEEFECQLGEGEVLPFRFPIAG